MQGKTRREPRERRHPSIAAAASEPHSTAFHPNTLTLTHTHWVPGWTVALKGWMLTGHGCEYGIRPQRPRHHEPPATRSEVPDNTHFNHLDAISASWRYQTRSAAFYILTRPAKASGRNTAADPTGTGHCHRESAEAGCGTENCNARGEAVCRASNAHTSVPTRKLLPRERQ